MISFRYPCALRISKKNLYDLRAVVNPYVRSNFGSDSSSARSAFFVPVEHSIEHSWLEFSLFLIGICMTGEGSNWTFRIRVDDMLGREGAGPVYSSEKLRPCLLNFGPTRSLLAFQSGFMAEISGCLETGSFVNVDWLFFFKSFVVTPSRYPCWSSSSERRDGSRLAWTSASSCPSWPLRYASRSWSL